MPISVFSYQLTKGLALCRSCRSFAAAVVLLPAAAFFLTPGIASAAGSDTKPVLNCTVQPSCAELGYARSDVEDCAAYVKCPFDTAYKACVKIEKQEPCTTGYARNVADCGSRGASGWSLSTSSTDNAGCYKCQAKTCSAGFATTVDRCGSFAPGVDNGYELGTYSSGYSGDTACKQCIAKDCPSGSATSVSGCGTSGSKGWTLGSSTGMSAGRTCRECEMKSCPSGWTHLSLSGQVCKGVLLNHKTAYAGDVRCFKCDASCPDTTYDCGNLGYTGSYRCTNNPPAGKTCWKVNNSTPELWQ